MRRAFFGGSDHGGHPSGRCALVGLHRVQGHFFLWEWFENDLKSLFSLETV